jgi:hypothetical protein
MSRLLRKDWHSCIVAVERRYSICIEKDGANRIGGLVVDLVAPPSIRVLSQSTSRPSFVNTATSIC